MRELVEAKGMRISSIATSMNRGQMGSADPELREEAKTILRKQLKAAKLCGATHVLTVPGGDQDYSLQMAFEQSIKTIKELLPEIEASGVKIAVENVWNSFFMSPYDVERFLDAINHASCGMYFDVGNMLEWSTAESWLEILGHSIIGVHLKDYQSNVEGQRFVGGDRVPIGQGDCHWDRVIPQLLEIPYNGAWIIESYKPEDPNLSYETFFQEIYNTLHKMVKKAQTE